MTGTHGPAFDLDAAAERIHVRPGDVTTVIDTARRRTTRRRRAIGGTAALAVLASATAVVRLGADTDDSGTVAASGGSRRGTIGVRWQRVDAKASLGMTRGESSGFPIYALSTAPGERESRDGRPLSRVVWRSDDGVEWTAASTLGPDLYLSDLDTRDRRVYAVGTAPTGAAVTAGPGASLASADLIVGWSDDGARQWQQRKLPLDLASAPTRRGAVADAKVASGPAGVLAVAILTADLDVPALLPSGATAPHGWSTTATGVDVLGPPRSVTCPAGMKAEPVEKQPEPAEVTPTWCTDGDRGVAVTPQEARGVTAHYSFADLGVSGDVLHAVNRRLVAFLARPGSTDFERVALPEIDHASFLTVEASERGFDVVTSQGDRHGLKGSKPVHLHSADGRRWEPVPSPVGAGGWVAAAGAVDGRSVLVTGHDTGVTVALADGEGRWSTTPVADLFDEDVLRGRNAVAGTATIGPFGIVIATVLAPPSGGTSKELSNFLLLSRDGTLWEVVPLSEVVGEERASVTRITMDDRRIVVTASVPTGAEHAPRKQVTAVGTLD